MTEKTHYCIACREKFTQDAVSQEANITICTPCKERKIILPGQYFFALHLWKWFFCDREDHDPLPSFWPLENGKPMMIGSILTVAVANDQNMLPCGTRCYCDYIGNSHGASMIKHPLNVCVFYKLDNIAMDRKAALLIYWWYCIYSSQSRIQSLQPPLSEFWPSQNGKLLSPREIVQKMCS